jgi:hypothetical protein
VLHTSFTSTGAASAAAILAAAAGVRYRIWKIVFTSDGAAIASIHEGTDGATTRLIYATCAAGVPIVVNFDHVGGIMLSAANVALNLTTNAANCYGVVYYTKGVA